MSGNYVENLLDLVYHLQSLDKGEEIVFSFTQTRVADIPIFIDSVLIAEAENKLVEHINKYFIF